ncbi:unnamed protein product [Agarophyton chilense]|eukprot:gb/GEZJ01004817.1/.p1 GENE.gb/GEZJ01004817.1/~~gb/GEZJ01004817.1/.p1  ORF type:complete len:474 (+),score=43.36 gb/GEZJ01004817.1/:189-1610(+)
MRARRPRLLGLPIPSRMAFSGCAFVPISHTFQIPNRPYRSSGKISRPLVSPVRHCFAFRPSQRPLQVRILASADHAAADDASNLPDDSLQPFQPSQSPLQSSASSPLQSQSSVPVEEQAEAKSSNRPEWAPEWLPDFFLDLRRRPWLQLAIMLPLYAFHLFFLSTKGFKFKNPIIPNNKNLFQSIGYESIAGAIVAIAMLLWRRYLMPRRQSQPVLPNVLSVENPPWKVPRDAKRRIGRTTVLLIVAYLISGYGAVFSEQVLYLLAGSGIPLTVATTRAWKVLLGHLMWVYMGIGILRRLKPFFPPKGTWLRWKWRSNWLWWAIGGYYVSALFFNIADVVNQLVLPPSLFEEETVVSKLINPENKDRVAMAIGSIGPCVSAPVFEEVLYRGFLLPALACFLPMWAAIPASSVLFAIHHLNPTMILPLSMLGFIWANLYSQSRNLTVTILIHAMWNSRVFLGSLLGLGTFTDFE